MPEQVPPKAGAKQEPLIDPEIEFFERIWTEHPLFSLQLYKHSSLSPVTNGAILIVASGAEIGDCFYKISSG